MNVIDIVLLVVALLAFMVGWRKGLIRGIGGVVALVAGLIVARLYASNLADVFSGWWADMDEKVMYIIAFAVVFLGANILVTLLARLLENIMKALLLGWANRICGAVLSLFVAAFMMSIVLNIYEFADKNHRLLSQEQIDESALYQPILKVLPQVVPELKQFYQESLQEMENLPKKAMAGQQQII